MALLPPAVVGPLSQCSPGVRVQGQLSGATVALYQNGVQVGSGIAQWSDQVFDFASNVTLVPGAKVTARQTLGAQVSPASPLPVTVQAKPATLAYAGILMAPLPLSVIMSLFATAVVFAFVLDEVKARVFRALGMR